jgi:hypothetical protein
VDEDRHPKSDLTLRQRSNSGSRSPGSRTPPGTGTTTSSGSTSTRPWAR